MAVVVPPDLEAIKMRQRRMWSSGDSAQIGATITIAGEMICEAADVRAGQQVLDVSAVDNVPALLERGRASCCASAVLEGRSGWRAGRPRAGSARCLARTAGTSRRRQASPPRCCGVCAAPRPLRRLHHRATHDPARLCLPLSLARTLARILARVRRPDRRGLLRPRHHRPGGAGERPAGRDRPLQPGLRRHDGRRGRVSRGRGDPRLDIPDRSAPGGLR